MSATPKFTRRSVGISVVGLLVGILLWWMVINLAQPPSYILPPPEQVAHRLIANPDFYASNALATAWKIIIGGVIGTLVGISMGSVMGTIPSLRNLFMPYVITLRILPKIAIAPVLLLYIGIGLETALLFVAIITFFPVTISTAAGFARTPERHLELMDSVSATRFDVLSFVQIPYALPDIFAGLKQAAVLSVIGAIVAEWVVSTNGLGYLILIASERVQTSVLLAALIVLMGLGLAVYAGITLLQYIFLRRIDRYSTAR